MKHLKIAAVASFAFVAGSAGAAQDGLLSSDAAANGVSAGESIVTIIKDNAVQITKVDDLDFGNVATLTAATASESDDVCVFSSTSLYDVAVTSANGFALADTGAATNNNADTVSYDVEWNGAAIVTDGTPAPRIDETGNNVNLDCSDDTAGAFAAGNNASFGVTLDAAEFNAAAPGTYQDTLTLTISPS